jgi:hypothetical protein
MALYCRKCKSFRKVDMHDFLTSRKKQIVCGHCATVLMTLVELYEEMEYNELYYDEV